MYEKTLMVREGHGSMSITFALYFAALTKDK